MGEALTPAKTIKLISTVEASPFRGQLHTLITLPVIVR